MAIRKHPNNDDGSSLRRHGLSEMEERRMMRILRVLHQKMNRVNERLDRAERTNRRLRSRIIHLEQNKERRAQREASRIAGAEASCAAAAAMVSGERPSSSMTSNTTSRSLEAASGLLLMVAAPPKPQGDDCNGVKPAVVPANPDDLVSAEQGPKESATRVPFQDVVAEKSSNDGSERRTAEEKDEANLSDLS
mmetsp:Transcript_31911/g.66604  ORF Transcript_31911/g.66604 Transcript_31911/m.66604 type:complete len:193 (-) Transcript_31911:289-867(-)|eukprot:CAMPEP_0172466756 /NCGR_PEP_ID=MMETSP1065-20121228/57067_1 /TAXON_ID=265537 /ORGANISM="Amphiprora paludosa, Strain CCMP125" /LENGTH=192 /DNA_ID=CAMNT_0013223671 /DNA_START=21 /DNA_END=599 /DNA_ORIENTATION=+